MNFTKQELIDMIYTLGESDRNCFLASRIYAQKYPDRAHPQEASFKNLKNRFEETGDISYKKNHRTKRTTNEDNEHVVLLSLVEDCHTSSRNISRQTDISQSSVTRIIRRNKFHGYHVQLLQELGERDFLNRFNFCVWAANRMQETPNFFEYVLFSDEATFHKNGNVNRHNLHYYATENPKFVRTVDHQHRWSLNVWAGIIGDRIVGPHFFDFNLNGDNYLNFLQNDFEDLVDELLPLEVIRRLWIQQDGAPPHYSVRVREYLNNVFPDRWIGRGGPINWPARSPDLTKLDFYLWGYVKDQVYQTPPTTRDDMKNRIRNAFQSVDVDTLRRVSNSFQS